MTFFSNFFNFNPLKKIEQEANEILNISNTHKAYRTDNEIIVISSNKIVFRAKDTFPSNSERTKKELSKILNIKEENIENSSKEEKKSSIWTCGFRDFEGRWVWYNNSEPKMTVDFKEAFKNGSLEDKVYFFSARYGTSIISKIKEKGLEKTAKDLNALILKNSYIKISCNHCSNEENYTIDDIVNENKQPNYHANFIICQNCDNLIKLQ